MILLSLFHCFCVASYKFHCFVNSIYHHQERRGKSTCLFKANTISELCNSFHILKSLTFIFHHYHSSQKVYFEVTLFSVITIVAIMNVSQVVLFKPILYFKLYTLILWYMIIKINDFFIIIINLLFLYCSFF